MERQTNIIKYFKNTLNIDDFYSELKKNGVCCFTHVYYRSKKSDNIIICSLLEKYLATSYAVKIENNQKIYPHYHFKVYQYGLRFRGNYKKDWKVIIFGKFEGYNEAVTIEIGLPPFKKFMRRNNKIIFNEIS